MLNLPSVTDLQPTATSADRTSFADNFLRIALDIGEGLLKCGAEVWRVELTIEKICKAYGAEHVEVFSINSVIVATVRMADGQFSNQVRRILDISNHLICLEEYNSLSRYICENRPPIEEIDARIKKIKELRKSPLIMDIIGSVLAAGSFAVFFGGSLRDGVCAGIIAISVALLSRLHFDYFNKMVHTIMMSFVSATLACIAVAIGFGDSMDMINIGTIMTLIPGVYLGNAMRDLLCGDTLSGTIKIVQAVITSVMIAIGYAIPIFIFDGFLA